MISDLRAGYTSERAVREIYQVVFDSKSFRIDMQETQKKREAAREQRKSLGKPFEEFMKTWANSSPPQHALEYFGDWPGEIS